MNPLWETERDATSSVPLPKSRARAETDETQDVELQPLLQIPEQIGVSPLDGNGETILRADPCQSFPAAPLSRPITGAVIHSTMPSGLEGVRRGQQPYEGRGHALPAVPGELQQWCTNEMLGHLPQQLHETAVASGLQRWDTEDLLLTSDMEYPLQSTRGQEVGAEPLSLNSGRTKVEIPSKSPDMTPAAAPKYPPSETAQLKVSTNSTADSPETVKEDVGNQAGSDDSSEGCLSSWDSSEEGSPGIVPETHLTVQSGQGVWAPWQASFKSSSLATNCV